MLGGELRICEALAASAVAARREARPWRKSSCRSLPWLSALASAAEDTIRVGWTIPEEAKYGIMRRPDRFANLGKTYEAEFAQFAPRRW